jgi:hypothetical protein
LQSPRWIGDDLAGLGLLVLSDAGHGDAIQMARYARLLRARGARRLVFYGQAGLQRLLAESGDWDDVLRFDEPLPLSGWQVWAPVMSLPYLCESRLERLPGAGPYLRSDVERRAVWRARLQGEGPAEVLRVGLVWQGNPRHENDADRSLPHLSAFEPLARLPGIRLYGLQSGPGAEAVTEVPGDWPLARLAADPGDFAETAALVDNLDLVIGVDTSVVHLAGALGVPVWVLLPWHKPDWRWLDGRSDSPWYPGVMRLFRQREAGDWPGLMIDVARALASWAAGCPPRPVRHAAAAAAGPESVGR